MSRLTQEEFDMVKLLLVGGDPVECKLASIIIRLLNEPELCYWDEDVSGIYHGTCGVAWEMSNHDGLIANKILYCPRCGRKIGEL